MEEIDFSALRYSADTEVLTGSRAGLVKSETRGSGGPGSEPSEPLSLAKLEIPSKI